MKRGRNHLLIFFAKIIYYQFLCLCLFFWFQENFFETRRDLLYLYIFSSCSLFFPSSVRSLITYYPLFLFVKYTYIQLYCGKKLFKLPSLVIVYYIVSQDRQKNMQTVGRGSNFCDFSLITKKKKITRKYRILSSILHQCDFALISYLTLTLILVFKPQNRYTKSERRNHLSVFFAKIIRLLRKLFNDLSLTRTRFGRRLSLQLQEHVQFLQLLKNNIIIKQALQQYKYYSVLHSQSKTNKIVQNFLETSDNLPLFS